ncbi:MAG: exodeoxyribonuclease VII large subunit, partial [Defluviicoccus sp.]
MPGTAPVSLEASLPVFTVTEISLTLKRFIEQTFDRVRVRGEISGFKRAASGHLYFALKDQDSVLDAVCWRGAAQRFKAALDNGLEVIVTGRLTSYPARSRYQILVDAIELAGAGALLKLLEERRRKLDAEGLFAAQRKRPIPYLPDVIGVITSPTGAVIKDILHRLADRFPRHVLLWPVAVQGQGAAEQIAAAIEGFNRLPAGGEVPRPDVLIVARGGGSLEDLWAFNEEIVVRAAAASAIPLIAAVGHETDTTLIDFAADVRAPTPTAAAEFAVPVRSELIARVLGLASRQISAAGRMLEERRTRLTAASRGLPQPLRLLALVRQRLDDWSERFENALAVGLQARRQRLQQAAA